MGLKQPETKENIAERTFKGEQHNETNDKPDSPYSPTFAKEIR